MQTTKIVKLVNLELTKFFVRIASNSENFS